MPRTARDPKQRFTVYLTEEQLRALDQLAIADGSTMAEHLRRAINEYLARYALTRASPVATLPV